MDNYIERKEVDWKNPALLATISSLASDPLVMTSIDAGIRQRGAHIEVLEQLQHYEKTPYTPIVALNAFEHWVTNNKGRNKIVLGDDPDNYVYLEVDKVGTSGQEFHKNYNIMLTLFVRKDHKEEFLTIRGVAGNRIMDMQDLIVSALFEKIRQFAVKKASLRTYTLYKRYLLKGESQVVQQIKENKLQERNSFSAIPSTNLIIEKVKLERTRLRKQLLECREDLKTLLLCFNKTHN
jgi:hypothetical protein